MTQITHAGLPGGCRGVQGHPLQLTVCNLLTTPASDVSCANSLAAANPVAVVVAAVDNATPIVTARATAGVPYAAMTANAPAELTNPDAFAFSGSNNGSFNMVAQNEKKLGGTKVTLVTIGAAGVEASLAATVAPTFVLGNQASAVQTTSPLGQPDMTPTIQAATSNGSTSVFLDEDPPTCIAGLNAKGTLAITGVRFCMDGSCETKAVVTAAGANATNTYFPNPTDPSNTRDPDYATYHEAMAKYALGVQTLGFSPVGFAVLYDLYRFMKTIPAETAINAASVKQALRTAQAVPAFLGANTTLTCNGKAVPLQPSLCSGSFFLEKWTGSAFTYIGFSTLPSS
jgi:branched-chain amino acid transport system substrate-binding protein